jgi:regulatory protein
VPVVTDITRQQRNAGRYSVYVDGTYSLSLSDLELSNSGLRIGQSVTAQQLAGLQDRAVSDKAYTLALGYLAYRPRSRREVGDYLGRKAVEPEVADAVVERLLQQNLVNDHSFAEAWVCYRQSLRPRSRRQLHQELVQKGIAREVIEDVLAGLGDDEQLVLLAELIEKKRRSAQYQNPEKLMAYLARQGFGYDLIKKALARLGD